MSCLTGLNQYLTASVPVINGDGPALDVSTLVAGKTIYLSGAFSGQYVILGSHDDVIYVPIASFNGGQGPQAIRRDVAMTLKSIKVRRGSPQTVVVNVASQSVCPCS